MRTVDPEQWYRKIKKPRIQVTRTMKYGMKPVTGFERHFRASFNDALRDFRNNCSVRAIVQVSRMEDNWQKIVYIAMLIATLCIGVCVVCYDFYLLANKPPLLISPQTSQRSALYVHFPAVAVCSTNIFSSEALNEYIRFLSSKDNNSTYTETDIRRNLLNFGALMNRNLPSSPVDVMFTSFLTRVHSPFNMSDLMFKLSPKCPSMLRRCSWRGRVLPCERLFATRITHLGYCCVFNSRYQPEDVDTPPKILDMVGKDYGLTFLMQNKKEDFVYSRQPDIGYEVLLFDGREYPLMQGGGVRAYPAPHNATVGLAVSARVYQPSSSLNYYNPLWRGCHLHSDTGARSLHNNYVSCLVQCRRRAVVALCDCAPFNLPSGPELAPYCTPDNLACLDKHREKFMYYYPGEHSPEWSTALGEEMQDALDCLHCTPDCARLVYSGTVTYANYWNRSNFFQNRVTSSMSLDNVTVVRIFYTAQHQHQLYFVEGNLRWYEVVAMVSCEWVSVTGMSVLVVMELVFCCVCRWPLHYRRRARMALINNSVKS